jgi:acetylornithine deacetylase/succinyl-diaminopimelate desuccinylase-like protein
VPAGSLNSEAFKALKAAVKKNYDVVTLPAMGTGATDMSYLRRKGVECYGIGPTVDVPARLQSLLAGDDQRSNLRAGACL